KGLKLYNFTNFITFYLTLLFRLWVNRADFGGGFAGSVLHVAFAGKLRAIFNSQNRASDVAVDASGYCQHQASGNFHVALDFAGNNSVARGHISRNKRSFSNLDALSGFDFTGDCAFDADVSFGI